jgi:hypothetical protein
MPLVSASVVVELQTLVAGAPVMVMLLLSTVNVAVLLHKPLAAVTVTT